MWTPNTEESNFSSLLGTEKKKKNDLWSIKYGQLNIHSTARVDADSSTKLNTFC